MRKLIPVLLIILCSFYSGLFSGCSAVKEEYLLKEYTARNSPAKYLGDEHADGYLKGYQSFGTLVVKAKFKELAEIAADYGAEYYKYEITELLNTGVDMDITSDTDNWGDRIEIATFSDRIEISNGYNLYLFAYEPEGAIIQGIRHYLGDLNGYEPCKSEYFDIYMKNLGEAEKEKLDLNQGLKDLFRNNVFNILDRPISVCKRSEFIILLRKFLQYGADPNYINYYKRAENKIQSIFKNQNEIRAKFPQYSTDRLTLDHMDSAERSDELKSMGIIYEDKKKVEEGFTKAEEKLAFYNEIKEILINAGAIYKSDHNQHEES